jgi:hypothetical protein
MENAASEITVYDVPFYNLPENKKPKDGAVFCYPCDGKYIVAQKLPEGRDILGVIMNREMAEVFARAMAIHPELMAGI